MRRGANAVIVVATAGLVVAAGFCRSAGAAPPRAPAFECADFSKPCVWKDPQPLAPDTIFELHADLKTDGACDHAVELVYNPPSGSVALASDSSYKCLETAKDKKAHTYQCLPLAGQAPAAFVDGSALSAQCSNYTITLPLSASAPATRSPGKSPKGNAATPAAKPGPPFLPLSIWSQVLADLRLPLGDQALGHYYNRAKDAAVIFLDADATPYFPMLDVVDEDDDIFVAVVDTPARMAGAEISVQGCGRTPTLPRVYGSISQTLGGQRSGGGEKTKPEEPLQIVLRAVGRCSGADTGGPSVTVRSASGQSHAVTIPVNPLYRFAIGLGVGVDFTMDRSFDVRTAAGESAPSITESRDLRGITTLLYVSMYLAPRDFHKKDVLWQRCQLFAGLDPTNLENSLAVGLGFELAQGVNLLAGWRVLVKEPVLAEGSGLQVGSFFSGTKDTIPTRERWEVGLPFVGLGLSSDILSRIR